MTAREKPICNHCGSSDVLNDSYSAWNAETQQYEHVSEHDNWLCEDCGGETSTIWIPVQIPEIINLQRILKDETRYVECYAMNFVDKHRDKLIDDVCDTTDATLNQQFEHGTEPDFYDFIVRSDDEENDHFFEVEEVLPKDCHLIEQALKEIFKCEVHDS